MTNERECGKCSLCCKLLPIRELNKPIDTWCPHCRPGHGGCTIPDPVGQALFQCCVPALWSTAAAIAITIEAPSTVLLRLCGFFDADNSRENSRHKQQEPHGRLVYAALIRIASRVPS